MKRRGTKLLILLLAAAIAWQLGLLAEGLTVQLQEARALEQSIAAVRGDIADLNAQPSTTPISILQRSTRIMRAFT